MTCYLHGSTARDFLGNGIVDQELRQLQLGADFHDFDVIYNRLGRRRFLNHLAYKLDGEGCDFKLIRGLKEAAKAK